MDKIEEIILGNIKVCLRETSLKTSIDDDKTYDAVLKVADKNFKDGFECNFEFRFIPKKEMGLKEGCYILQIAGEVEIPIANRAAEEVLLTVSYLSLMDKLCVFGASKDKITVKDEVFLRQEYGAKTVTQIALDSFNILYQTLSQNFELLRSIANGELTFAQAVEEGLFSEEKNQQ